MIHYTAIANEKQFDIHLDEDGGFHLDEKLLEVSAQMVDGLVHIRIGGRYMIAYCKSVDDSAYEVWINHHVIHVKLEDDKSRLERRFGKATASHLGILTIRAPMPGLVIERSEERRVGKECRL